MKTKRILSAAVALVMALTLFPALTPPAQAAPVTIDLTSYSLLADGIYGEIEVDATTITYNGTDAVTLTGTTDKSVVITLATDITLDADASIMVPFSTSATALRVPAGAVVTGGGSGVTLQGGLAAHGIYAQGDLTLEGIFGNISGWAHGISAVDDVTINGTTGEISGGNCGIIANGSVFIIGAIGNITGGSASGRGINANNDVNIYGTVGDISASGGIFADGGEIYIIGTVGDITAGGVGIRAYNDVTVNGTVGNITVTKTDSETGGISASSGSVTINGEVGDITVTGTNETMYMLSGTGIWASDGVNIGGAVGKIQVGGHNGIGIYTAGNSSLSIDSGGEIDGIETTGPAIYASGGVNINNGTMGEITSTGSNGIQVSGGSITIAAAVTIKGASGAFNQNFTVPSGFIATVSTDISGSPSEEVNAGETVSSMYKYVKLEEFSPPLPEPSDPGGNTNIGGGANSGSGGGGGGYIPPLPDPEPETAPENIPSDWAKESVKKALELELVPRRLQGDYRNDLKRSEFAALAVRLYELLSGKEITTLGNFDDTTDLSVRKLAGLGIVKGDGKGNFDPSGTFTREMAITLMYNMMIQLGYEFSDADPSFADAGDISPWAKQAIGALHKAKIIKGDGQYFNPKLIFTREMGIQMIINFLEYIK